MGRILGKCPNGHVNEATPGQIRCLECQAVLTTKGWMPTVLAADLLATHGKRLNDLQEERMSDRTAIPLVDAVNALNSIVDDYMDGDHEAYMAFVEDPSLILYIGVLLNAVEVYE